MRALAPLPAFLLLAASAAACPFGFPGHVHPSIATTVPASPLPEGRCTGRSAAPAPHAALAGGPPYDLRAFPIPAERRPYWEMIGYRIDDAAGRLRDADGALVAQAEIDALHKPFDASTERLDAAIWRGFITSGYRLDEETCRLMGPDAKALDTLTMRVWRELGRRGLARTALEALLAKLNGLDTTRPVPDDLRNEMLALAKAGTPLPENIKKILERNGATVGQLRAPAAASYADSMRYYDGRRPLSATLEAAWPESKPGAAARRKGIADPDERVLGAALSSAFNAELSKTAPGRELLSRFRGPKGMAMPDVMVLKLTQSPNDPNAPGAIYDASDDRMIINHWHLARILHSRLPPEKLEKIAGRLADAKHLSKLLAEDPSLLPVITDELDLTYFHELTHAAQARRNRITDELLRGNLPNSAPLAQEHEAYREQCRYLFSKSATAIDRSSWRDECLGLIKDPKAFQEEITRGYLSRFAGSATLDDLAARQEARRRTSRSLESVGGVGNWIEQKLKQLGYDNGDAELAAYRLDADERERSFLHDVPALGRRAGEKLVALYQSRGADARAFALEMSLPPGSRSLSASQIASLADQTAAWIARDGDPARRGERLAALAQVAAYLKKQGRDWPADLVDAYQRDARSLAESFLDQALNALPAERERLLDQAKDLTNSLHKPGDLPARIEGARPRPR